MRRKLGQNLPNLSFKNNILIIPGYRFNEARLWNDTGSLTRLAEGFNLKDGASVVAKIAPAHSNGSLCLERELHLLGKLATYTDATRVSLSLVDYFNIAKDAGDCIVIVLLHPGANQLGRYFPSSRINDLLLPWVKKEKAAGVEGGDDRTRTGPHGSELDIEMEDDSLPPPFEESDATKAAAPIVMDVDDAGSDQEEPSLDNWDIMDLASFLEFSVSATHCLEILHKTGLIHREVRANAFHVNAHSGAVRFAHFGNRSVSLEKLGGPSALVISADTMPLKAQWKVKEAMCYLAPEQTGSAETIAEDHRTDLYALGVLFWTLLVGHGTLPFEGTPMELLHSIVQVKPMLVHEVRRDVPEVVSHIVAKLLSKSPDERYNSAVGLKNDLVGCQRLLTLSCASTDVSSELIPSFAIGQHDMFLELTIPATLFGRDRELELIRSVIRTAAASAAINSVSANANNNASPAVYNRVTQISQHQSTPATGSSPAHDSRSIGTSANAPINASLPNVQSTAEGHQDGGSDGGHTPEGSPSQYFNIPLPAELAADSAPALVDSPFTSSTGIASGSTPMQSPFSVPPQDTGKKVSAIISSHSAGTSTSGATGGGVGMGIGANGGTLGVGGRSSRTARAHSVVVCGPAGIGKSSLIVSNQATWRSHGLWGYAKMIKGESSPFTGLLSCLSSVLRQLMVFHSDLHLFVGLLKARLGQHIHHVPLLYHDAPELRDILALFHTHLAEPRITLSTEELGARFQSLVENVYGVLADIRPLALFLDDIHFADKSSLDMIGMLANSKSRLLILATCRSDDPIFVSRVRQVFSSKARTTWIDLEPLGYNSLSSLVANTLKRPKDDVMPLTRLVLRVSMGNPFVARNLLTTVRRQGHIWYEWGVNTWQYNLEAIEQSVHSQQLISAPTDISFLVAHFKELPEEARKYLVWASLFGPTFRIEEIANMMDGDDGASKESGEFEYAEDLASSKQGSISSGSELAEEMDESGASYSKPSMRGLQQVLAHGWLVQRARDMCNFTHDKYRQAATHMASQLPDIVVMKMCLRIAFKLMQEPLRDFYRIAEYCRRCLPLIREHPKREEFVDSLIQAAESSTARGAHELALQAFVSARTLLGEGSWHDFPERTLRLSLKISELYGSQGNHEASDSLITELLEHAHQKEDRARALRLRSRNRFVQRDFDGAFNDTVQGLGELGVIIPNNITPKEADAMFDQVKAEILAIGFDNILNLPRATNPNVDLVVSLLNDAGTNAFWGAGKGYTDYIGLTTITIALREGISPGTAVGLLWCLGGASERRQLYRFCADLAMLALQISHKFGGSSEKCRAEVLYAAMVSGYQHEHLRTVIPRIDMAVKLARSAGDRIYEGFARCHALATRLYCSEHLSDLLIAADEGVADIRVWTVNSDTNALAMSILMTIRALAGETHARSADTVFDTEKWKEAHFLSKLHESSGNLDLTMNWYNSFKVCGLYSLGFFSRAAELGFEVYKTRHLHPSYRQVRYGLVFHSLAMIQCLRYGNIPQTQRERYLQQIDLNQGIIRLWVSPSSINNSAWHALVQAELASLLDDQDAFRLYDNAVKLAVNNDWIMEEGWALYLEGCHLQRAGVEALGGELQRRGIARHTQWGAYGIVNHLKRTLTAGSDAPVKREIFSTEVGVQTDIILLSDDVGELFGEAPQRSAVGDDDELTMLNAEELTDVLKWSQTIAADINLTSSLQRLTEIATEYSNAQDATLAMRGDDGEFTVATNLTPPQPCMVYECAAGSDVIISQIEATSQTTKIYPKDWGPPETSNLATLCVKTVVMLSESEQDIGINTRSRLFYPDLSSEPRFALEASQSTNRSVICIPMSNNRGQIYGALFLGTRFSFTQSKAATLSVLCQQASVSIANALLFRSVQQATKANLQMIQNQKQALEEARSSREDAMKATRIKSNFLASMSHELRTPFSSFYGLLDILGGTRLDANQRELVQTAKQSCELLLKIIDSILDYSKLEASALKLEPVPFLVEDVLADCVELLLPLAAKKLDLSFDIHPEVPIWALADYSRIRQVIMNLLGNALKFTSSGSVRTICSVEHSIPCQPDEVVLKWAIQDTGIGLSESDIKNLWQPFSQADNSSTRRFGGTGLGLSISLSLVKLMRGDIGVQSEVGVGSEFWFYIPVQIYKSAQTQQIDEALGTIRRTLCTPRPLRILVSSPSTTTQSLLRTILDGFEVECVSSVDDAVEVISSDSRGARSPDLPVFDFILLDHMTEKKVQKVKEAVDATVPHNNTKIIQLYTPTSAPSFPLPWARSSHGGGAPTSPPPVTHGIDNLFLSPTAASFVDLPSFTRPRSNGSNSRPNTAGRVTRMNKPPRRARLLQLLGTLKGLPPMPSQTLLGIPSTSSGISHIGPMGPTSQIGEAMESLEAIKEMIKGMKANVLIAEDNPVAHKLLLRQLQQYDLNVVATMDGNAAVKEWESRPPGYFNFALFDHHMPICDGVEAAKRIRALETRRKITPYLPIIALSADCQESTKELCLSAGMNGFLTKPMRQGDLPKIIQMYGTDMLGTNGDRRDDDVEV